MDSWKLGIIPGSIESFLVDRKRVESHGIDHLSYRRMVLVMVVQWRMHFKSSQQLSEYCIQSPTFQNDVIL